MTVYETIELFFEIRPDIKELVTDKYSLVTTPAGQGFTNLSEINNDTYLDINWVGLTWNKYIFPIGVFYDNQYSTFDRSTLSRSEAKTYLETVTPFGNGGDRWSQPISEEDFRLVLKLNRFLNEA